LIETTTQTHLNFQQNLLNGSELLAFIDDTFGGFDFHMHVFKKSDAKLLDQWAQNNAG
jgi:hypothetical protein